jgi:hypothetical protein
MRNSELNDNIGNHTGWLYDNGSNMYDGDSLSGSRKSRQRFGKTDGGRKHTNSVLYVGTQLQGFNIFQDKV